MRSSRLCRDASRRCFFTVSQPAVSSFYFLYHSAVRISVQRCQCAKGIGQTKRASKVPAEMARGFAFALIFCPFFCPLFHGLYGCLITSRLEFSNPSRVSVNPFFFCHDWCILKWSATNFITHNSEINPFYNSAWTKLNHAMISPNVNLFFGFVFLLPRL